MSTSNSSTRTILFVLLGVLVLVILGCGCLTVSLLVLSGGEDTPSSSPQPLSTRPMSSSGPSDSLGSSGSSGSSGSAEGTGLDEPIPSELLMWVAQEGSYAAGNTSFTVSLLNNSDRTVRVSVLVLRGNLLEHMPSVSPSAAKIFTDRDDQGYPYMLFLYECPGAHCIVLDPGDEVSFTVTTYLPEGKWRGVATVCWEDEHHCMQAPYGFTTR